MSNFLVIGGTGVMGTSAIQAIREKYGDNAFCRSTAVFIDNSNACGWSRNFIDGRTYLFAGP